MDVLTYRLNIMREGGVVWWRPVALHLALQTNYMYRPCGGEKLSVNTTDYVSVEIWRQTQHGQNIMQSSY